MKNLLKLFGYEFKNIYKQALVFSIISTFLFALSISVFCFSSDMVQGYRDYLDEADYYKYLGVYDVTGFDKYEELDGLCSYFGAQAYGITERYQELEEYPYGTAWLAMLQNGEKASGHQGGAYVFREELPFEMAGGLISGSYGGAADNERRENGQYPVYISDKVAEKLEVSVNESVKLNYELKDGNMHEKEFTVAGIYVEDDGVIKGHFAYDFIIPFAFIYENKDSIAYYEHWASVNACNFYLYPEKSSDVMDLIPKVRRLNAGGVGDYEEITLVNTMRYILIAVSVAIVAVTFVVLSNSLTITINSRKKFMAKLKLLGASTDRVAAMYFVLLILSFIASYGLAILLSYLLCGYFSSIAVAAFQYKVEMKLHWGAIGVLFGVGCLLIALRYLLFRRKIKKVSPAEFIKED